MPEEQCKFRGNSDLANDMKKLDTPYKVFMYLFSENIIEIIYNQTKLYNVQSDPSRPLDISRDELKSFLGICCIMSCIDVSNIRDYWSDSLGNKLIRETMSINCFEKIRGFLHFTDNRAAALEDSSQFDRLYKI